MAVNRYYLLHGLNLIINIFFIFRSWFIALSVVNFIFFSCRKDLIPFAHWQDELSYWKTTSWSLYIFAIDGRRLLTCVVMQLCTLIIDKIIVASSALLNDKKHNIIRKVSYCLQTVIFQCFIRTALDKRSSIITLADADSGSNTEYHFHLIVHTPRVFLFFNTL